MFPFSLFSVTTVKNEKRVEILHFEILGEHILNITHDQTWFEGLTE